MSSFFFAMINLSKFAKSIDASLLRGVRCGFERSRKPLTASGHLPQERIECPSKIDLK